MIARDLGWTLLGLAIGGLWKASRRGRWASSVTAPSAVHSAAASAARCSASPIIWSNRASIRSDRALFGGVGLVILGSCIGSLSAATRFKASFNRRRSRFCGGWQEGREYPLDKTDNQVGRDEHADIALFRDMRVEKQHVVIHREGKRYILKN